MCVCVFGGCGAECGAFVESKEVIDFFQITTNTSILIRTTRNQRRNGGHIAKVCQTSINNNARDCKIPHTNAYGGTIELFGFALNHNEGGWNSFDGLVVLFEYNFLKPQSVR